MAVSDQPTGDTAIQAPEFPIMRSREELDKHIEQTYGAEVLKTLNNSVKGQASMVEALHKQGLNGQAESIEKMYRLHRQEFDRKETLLGKVWKGVTWPFRKSWEFAKKHPVVATLLVAAAAAGGMYLLWQYAGALIPVPNVAAGVGAAAEELAPLTGGAVEGAPLGGAVGPNFTVPYPTELPPMPSLPPEVVPGVIPSTPVPGVPMPPPPMPGQGFVSPFDIH